MRAVPYLTPIAYVLVRTLISCVALITIRGRGYCEGRIRMSDTTDKDSSNRQLRPAQWKSAPSEFLKVIFLGTRCGFLLRLS